MSVIKGYTEFAKKILLYQKFFYTIFTNTENFCEQKNIFFLKFNNAAYMINLSCAL